MNIRHLTSIPALLLCITASAQKTYYYNAGQKKDRHDKAKSYAEFTATANGYDARQYAVNNEKLKMEGHYLEIPEQLNMGREGKFTYYHINGKVWREGLYKNNMRTGVWKSYSYSKGVLTMEENYTLDSLDGRTTTYSSATGTKASEGNYVNGKRQGEWQTYVNGVKVIEETYIDDELASEKRYDSTGRLIAAVKYKNRKISGGTKYAADGTESAFEPKKDTLPSIFTYIEQMPQASYNISEYLSQHIVYPKKAMKNGDRGKVIVRFIVDEEGNIDGVEIKKSVSPEIDAEAMRVVSGMPAWSPGMQNGEPVKVYYNLPINFQFE